MSAIFYFLCGCLYVIGLVFGLTYKEVSVVVCIYACPIICILCALLSVLKGNIRTFFGRVRFSVNTTLLILYINITSMFWTHYFDYMGPLGDADYLDFTGAFQLCVDDLTKISRELNITYEECNIYVYCYLFPSIVLFHLLQVLIFRNKKKRNTDISAQFKKNHNGYAPNRPSNVTSLLTTPE